MSNLPIIKDVVYKNKRLKGVTYNNNFMTIQDEVITIFQKTAVSDGATGARDEDEVDAWVIHDYLRRYTDISMSTFTKDLILYDILAEHKFNMFKSFINKYCPAFCMGFCNKIMTAISPSIYFFGVTIGRPFIFLMRLFK